MKFYLYVFPLCLFSLSACASVTKGSNQDISFTSTPEGANVKVYDILQDYDGGECISPCELKLDRRGVYRATFHKEGYHNVRVKIVPDYSTSGLAGGAGSAITGGGIGVGVDALTGAMKDLQPNPVDVKLIKIKKKTIPLNPNPASP